MRRKRIVGIIIAAAAVLILVAAIFAIWNNAIMLKIQFDRRKLHEKIFTSAVSIIFVILSCMTIALSGVIGLGGVIRSLIEKKISKKEAILHGILQFVLCGDVISSVVLYRTVKFSNEVTIKNAI